jgi:hypothetical protein
MHTLQITIPDAMLAQITRLQHDAGVPDTTALLSRAFAMLDMLLDHQRQGGQIIFQNADGTQETMPTLKGIQPLPTIH